MVTARQLVFGKNQDTFMRMALKLPFVHDLHKGGWLKDPFSSTFLAAACDYEAPRIVAEIISFVIFVLLEDHDSKRNKELCLKYGLITRNDKDDKEE